jgi:hypothetical protein
MSKKHFVALAERISKIEDVKARETAARAVADVCAMLSDNFQFCRFLRACGVESA